MTLRVELVGEIDNFGLSAIYQFVGKGTQMLSGALFYILAARIFSPSGLGNIALLIAVSGLFVIIFGIGLNTAATHFISSHSNQDFISIKKILIKIVSLGFFFSLIGLILVFLLSKLISIVFFHSEVYVVYIQLLSVVIMENVMFAILNGAILGLQRFKASAFISIVIWGIYYFGSLFLAFIFVNLYAIIIGWIIGMSLGILVDSFYIIFIPLKNYSKNENEHIRSKKILAYSLPVFLSTIITYGATYADRFIVAYLLNIKFLGIYNFALLIFTAMSFLYIPINNLTLPKFSQFFGHGEIQKIRKGVRYSSLVLTYFYVPISLGIATLGPTILYYIAGYQYLGATDSLIIVMILPAIFVSQTVLIQALASIRKTRILMYSSMCSLFGNLALSILLVPLFGLKGAALGFSSVYIISFIIMFIYARKEDIVDFDTWAICKIWLGSVIMSFFIFLTDFELFKFSRFSISSLLFLILEGFFIYLFVSKILKVFSNLEKEIILSMFPNRWSKLKTLLSWIIN